MVMRQIENDTLSDGLVSQLEELELFSRFILANPNLVGLPQLELENVFLEHRTEELSGGTLPAVAVGGIGEENRGSQQPSARCIGETDRAGGGFQA